MTRQRPYFGGNYSHPAEVESFDEVRREAEARRKRDKDLALRVDAKAIEARVKERVSR